MAGMIPSDKKGVLFFGTYPGIVEDIEDPDKLLRLKVRVFDIFSDAIPTEDLPWAVYRLPIGARGNEGFFTPCQVGDHVSVEFFYGDLRRPIVTGSLHYCPENKPNLPHEAWGGEDVVEHKRVGDETTPGDPEYPFHHIMTEHGITVEIYKEKTFCMTHRETGSAISIDKDGNIIVHSEANLWHSAQENDRTIIEGESKLEVAKDRTEEIDGNMTREIGGDESDDIGGGLTVKVGADGSVDIGGSATVKVGSSATIQVGGSATIKVGGATNVQSGGSCTVRAPIIKLN